ncbi:MAG: hypothetical protein K8R18_14125 [Parvibaculum sp.]|uniref:hypothetical protein n=1 Tax=Parvibaculum sp. TaxID=2024848 RepID=UPI0025FD431D|nr:hypothetical protein [Parvibaculum sp.]MCE9650754.1 hypothetical protein [Parvibaculum sp.]
MKPDIPDVLNGFTFTLLTEILPNLGAEYSMGNTAIMSQSLAVIANEFERGAEIRFRENEEMRALFAEAARVVDDKALAARLSEAAAGRDASLLISVLDAANGQLKTLLIELHAAVEVSKAAWAPALDAKIWDHLVAAAERRKLTLLSLG